MSKDKISSLIDDVIAGIGQHDGSEWKLKDTEKHISMLTKPGFEGLKNILSQTPVKSLLKDYQLKDAAAINHQKQYLRKSKGQIWFFLMALALGAFSLLPLDDLLWAGATKASILLQFFLIIIAALLAISNLVRNHFDQWHDNRADAELSRGQFFRSVINSPVDLSAPGYKADAATEYPLALQKLEFVRRHHIEMQYAYYYGRGNEHLENEKKKRKWVLVASLMAALAALPILVVGVPLIQPYFGVLGPVADFFLSIDVSGDNGDHLLEKSFLALGTLAAGLKATISNISAITRALASSTEYHQTARRLGMLYSKHLRRLRRQAADNKLEPVRRWFACCNGLMMSEHKKWQAARAAHSAPLMSLEELSQGAR